MNDFADIELSFGSFPLLARLCEGDARFPKSEAEWDAHVSRDTEAARRLGHASQPVHVDPDRFQKWCATFQVPPCLDAFRAYCIIHRLPRGHHHYGPTPLDSDVGPLGS